MHQAPVTTGAFCYPARAVVIARSASDEAIHGTASG